MVRLVLTLVVVLLSPTAGAQTSNPLKPVDTSSPRATLTSFETQIETFAAAYLDYRAEKSMARLRVLEVEMERLWQLFDLEEVPHATRYEVGEASAFLLLDILNRLPATPLDAIPGVADAEANDDVVRWAIPDTEIQIARVDDGPRAGAYLFSAETVARLPEFHARIIDLPPVRPTAFDVWYEEHIRFTGPVFPSDLVNAIPSELQFKVLGTPLWKVVLALMLGLTLVALTLLWARVMGRVGSSSDHRVRQLAARLTVPLVVAGQCWGLFLLDAWQLNLTGPFGEGANLLVAVILLGAIAWTTWLAIHFVIEIIIASPAIPDGGYNANLLRLVAKVGAAAAAAVVLIYGATEIGVPALGLVAGLGVGGFALALAAQSTVENLFGGVSLFADRPFRIGDFIKYGDTFGTVEQIGPRSSRLRGRDHTLTTVPNADLAKMHITNLSYREKILFQHVIRLRLQTSPLQLEWFTERLRQRLAEHAMVEKTDDHPRVRVLGFGVSSIDVDARAYVLTTNRSEFLTVQQELIIDIMHVVAEAGTGFALPSQTAYVARDKGIDESAVARVEAEARLRKVAADESDPPASAGHQRADGS